MAGGRVESRNADSACNPYLAAALALAAGMEGIEGQLDPGAPRSENLYAYSDDQLADIGVQSLPRSLGEAIDAFAGDPFITQVLGQELRDEFLKYKSAEWEEYNLTISPWEIKKYARLY
jgi:glutamine synthetase